MRGPVPQLHRRSRPVVLAAAVLLSAGVLAAAQIPIARPGQFGLDSATAQDRIDFRAAITFIRAQVVGVAEAMPADKYRFAQTAGEFHGVRTFGQQIKHLAATNYILAAAALGQAPPADAGDEAGPDSVHTKAQHLAYLAGSFEALDRAAADLAFPRGQRDTIGARRRGAHAHQPSLRAARRLLAHERDRAAGESLRCAGSSWNTMRHE